MNQVETKRVHDLDRLKDGLAFQSRMCSAPAFFSSVPIATRYDRCAAAFFYLNFRVLPLGSGLIREGSTLQTNGIRSPVYDDMVDRRREIRRAKAVFSEVAGGNPGWMIGWCLAELPMSCAMD
jgi:hypothetical protein